MPPRGYRRKSTARPPLGRALRALAAIAGVVAGALAVGYLLIMRHGDPSSGRAAAERQLREITLDPGERVRARTDVFQRTWYDYFRSTSGILVATDRRLIYVGVLPAETFTRENGPRVIDTRVYPGDTTIIVQPRRVFLGAARGVAITTRDRRDVFAVSSRDEPRLDSVLAIVRAWQAAERDAAANERAGRAAAALAARQPTYHDVQRGEAISTIATRYATTPEQLRAWNGLASDRIRVGQRLLVKPGG